MNIEEIKALMTRHRIGITSLQAYVHTISTQVTTAKTWLEEEIKEYEALDRQLAKLDGRYIVLEPGKAPKGQYKIRESSSKKALKAFKSMSAPEQKQFLESNDIKALLK